MNERITDDMVGAGVEAALVADIGVLVKPLEWDGNHAKSVVGQYSIVKHHNHYAMVGPDDSFDGFGYRFEGPLEKCREAAQLDFKTRICSVLVTSALWEARPYEGGKWKATHEPPTDETRRWLEYRKRPGASISMVKALQFYADPENWIDTPPWNGDPECITPKAIPVTNDEGRPCDCGDIARAALAAALQHQASLPVEVGGAMVDIAKERCRQIEAEGWTPAHDDKHDTGEMARAAGIYAVVAGSDRTDYRNATAGYALNDILRGLMGHYWPWLPCWFKPTNRRRDLVKAGALIIAEIERLDRLSAGEAR